MKVHHTKNKGDLGVLKVQADLFEKGFTILIPLSEHEDFDLVAYKNGNFSRVQVKYRKKINGKLEIPFKSSWADKNGTHTVGWDKDNIDFVGVYCPDTKLCYYFDPKNHGKSITLRIDESKQKQGINFAEDYLDVPI